MARDTFSRIEFLLSCIGYAVGLGNIWRFPSLCYKNGGGAFLIPYITFLIFGAAPVLIMELSIGQYMSQGAIGVWKLCPLFEGIGIATIILLSYWNAYYMLILAWGSYYFVMSMRSVVPWSHCNNAWNTDRCALSRNEAISSCLRIANASENNSSVKNCIMSNASSGVDPTVEFWERGVIQMTNGIEETGGVIWEIALCLLIVWIVIYFCVWKGVKWSGKVVYFTAVFPYVVLVILLIKGLTLEGALNGIKFFLLPDFTRLTDVQVWVDGGTQIFFSLAVAFGGLVTLGSYKKFNENFYKDSIIIMCVNSGTSILGGLSVFSVLGFMAQEQGVGISNITTSGTALAFITYPKAVTLMPLSGLWSALFFFMLFLVGVDSLFLGVEVVVTTIVDFLPEKFNKTRSRMLITAVYSLVLYLVGLSMTTRGGIYIWMLFDYFSASGMVLLWVCFWECIAVGWVFGADKLYDVIEMMLGFRINRFIWICLKFITPTLTMALLISQVTSLRLDKIAYAYTYPPLAKAFGLLLSLSSMICIPATMLYKLQKTKGNFKERIKKLTTPVLEPRQIPTIWQAESISIDKMKSEETSVML